MLYENLEAICRSQNKSISEVLGELNISKSMGSYWKNGKIPSGEIIIKLSEHLNVSTDYLLKGKEITIEQQDFFNNAEVTKAYLNLPLEDKLAIQIEIIKRSKEKAQK